MRSSIRVSPAAGRRSTPRSAGLAFLTKGTSTRVPTTASTMTRRRPPTRRGRKRRGEGRSIGSTSIYGPELVAQDLSSSMSRIFLAGAAGVIGRRLTPLLLAHGHLVWGTTRSPGNVEFLRKLGARLVVVDVFDAEALATAVLDAKPEIVMRQLTDLAAVQDPAQRSSALARNARIRDEGTRNLVAAARGRGASDDRAEHRLGLCP